MMLIRMNADGTYFEKVIERLTVQICGLSTIKVLLLPLKTKCYHMLTPPPLQIHANTTTQSPHTAHTPRLPHFHTSGHLLKT